MIVSIERLFCAYFPRTKDVPTSLFLMTIC